MPRVMAPFALILLLSVAYFCLADMREDLECQARDAMLAADEAYVQEQFEHAIDEYTEAILAYEHLRCLAEEELCFTNSCESIKDLRKGLCAFRSTYALSQRADCYRKMGDESRAKEDEELAERLMISISDRHSFADINTPWEFTSNWQILAGEMAFAADTAYAHGQLDSAVALYVDALKILDEIQRFLQEMGATLAFEARNRVIASVTASFVAVDRAHLLISLSDCYWELGDPLQAYACEEDAAQVMDSVGKGYSLSDIKAPWMLLREAERQLMRGDYEAAINLAILAHTESLDSEAADNTTAKEQSVEALLILGKSYSFLGLMDLATGAFQDSLFIAYELDDRVLEAHIRILLGICDMKLGRYFYAQLCFSQALRILEEQKDDVGLASCYLFLGLTKSPDDEDALLCFEHSLASAKRAELPALEVDTCLTLASFHLLKGNLDVAYDYLMRCLALSETGDWQLPQSVASIHRLIARYFQERGAAKPAIEHYREAIRLSEATRSHLESGSTKTLYMTRNLMSYHELVTTFVNVGDILSAFEYAERVKARTLSDMVETAMLTRTDILPPLLQTASSAYRALTAVQSMAFDPLLSTLSPTQRAMVTHSNQQCLEQYGAVLADLKRDHPQLGRTVSLTFAQSSEQLNDIWNQLDRGTLVLEYLVMRDETIVWVITQEDVQTASRIAITRDDLTAQVRGFREEIEEQPAPEQAATSYLSTLEKGRDLYELLIAPVENYLQGATHLVIVPSDVLFYLPFGALVHCPGCEERDLYGGEFLIELYSVSYAPSLSSLYWPFQHRGDGTYESVLAVGADPDPLYPLKYSAEEALAVSASFPHADLLLKQQCTEEEIKLKLQQKTYDVIHLSTHGRFDPILPLLSQVQFLPSAGEDGALHAGEILGLDLTGSLVVLSACQTALPPELTEESAGLVVGDEIQGLGQALFTAGASSVILTLWNVNDCSTSYLMEKMYQRLQDGAEKGEALRQAQLFLLGDPMYRHPCYWAPFVLYGDWR